ncbi:MAG: HAD family phosphatase [Verrucomicrobia bacterium]|nr:HAD family phosphatase [Verrucomicrobiota bacterium]
MAGRSTPAIVFDLGKVLLDFDYSVAVAKLEAQSRISALELKGLLDQSPLLYRYETGLVSTEEFFAVVQRQAGFRGDLKEFGAIFGDIFSPIEPMIKLHADLRALGLPTYLFSNTNALAIEHIRGRYSFYGLFQGHILSFEHGAMKPDPKLYEVVERLAGLRGGDLLYIDDRPENIAAGHDRDWRTILHVAPDATRGAIRRAGLRV